MSQAISTGTVAALDRDYQSHEQLEICSDDHAGLLAVIAVHSTTLGPAMGGVRRAHYPSLEAAVTDALRLSRAMTLKNSLAGLPLGGGKSVIIDAATRPSPALLDAFAAQLDRLGGRYVAAEDIGTTPDDMDRIAVGTRWVAGRSVEAGGTGDPSPSTARTVLGAIEHAYRLVCGADDLEGARVGVIGAGKVGGRLATLLAQRGAEVRIADIDRERAQTVAAETGAMICEPDALLSADLDVLAPCARGGVVTAANVDSLRMRILCGAANNILECDSVADSLALAGIFYVPEFLANAGGIIQVGGEFLEWDGTRIEAELQRSVDLAGEILEQASAGAGSALQIALQRAQERVALAAAEEIS